MLLTEQEIDSTATAEEVLDGVDIDTTCAMFALGLGLLEEVLSTEEVYPFSMKTTYTGGCEPTDE